MWLAAASTSLLLGRFNKSVSTKSCRAALLLLIHQTSFFTTTTTTFNSSSSSSSSSSKFGGGGTLIFYQQQQQQQQQANNSSSSSSKFGTIILQTNEPSDDLDQFGEKEDDIIKMFMLSSSSSGSGEEEEEEEEDKDDDQKKKKKKKKKKKEMVFKLDEDLGFSAIYKDFQLQDSIRMVGSCNGIICLHDPKSRFRGRDVYLWNPATRQFKFLPQSIGRSNDHEFIGFGFDVETQDYKVLRITLFVRYAGSNVGDGCECQVQVYNLSSNSWRVLDCIDSLPVSPTEDVFQNRQGTFLNGSCFFLGSKPINHEGIRDLLLLSFDFTKEIFTIMELPKCYCHKLVFSSPGIEDFDDILFDDILASPCSYDIRVDESVFFRTPRIDFAGGYVFTTDKIDFNGDGYWYYKMWNEEQQQQHDGKAKSWTRLHEFRIKTKSSKHPPYSELRCLSNDGEFALISNALTDDNGRNKFMLFNLATGKAIKDFSLGDHRDCRAAYVYKESQVSIMGDENALLRWQLPTHGTTYKLNLDAPLIDNSCFDKEFGIGLCLTSDTGGCIGVRSLNTVTFHAKVGEAKAMLEAIKWAKELELSPIIIESDSKNMVSFFMEEDYDNNLLTYWSSEDDDDDLVYRRSLSLLKEAKLLLKSSENSISIQYCSRISNNYVAEIASKLGRDYTTWSCKDWTANFPGEVVLSLSEDLGLKT